MGIRRRVGVLLGLAFATVDLAQARPLASWDFYSVSETLCRDATEAGYYLKQRSFDKKLMIYLEGGGACFNGLTCGQNPKSAGEQYPGEQGVFQDREDNPVRLWNAAYVPYCSGDLFAGLNRDVTVPGVKGKQQFYGFQNMQLILNELQQKLPDLETIVLAGVSAGGIGTLFQYPEVKARWPAARVVLLDDSGIPLEDKWLAPCLQTKFRQLWGIDQAIPQGCDAARGEDGGGLVNVTRCLSEQYPGQDKGMILSLQDATMRFFYGFGLNQCRPPLIPSMGGKTFEAGVLSLRENYLKGQVSSFVRKGSQHTFLGSNLFYDAKEGGQSLASWLSDLIAGEALDRGP